MIPIYEAIQFAGVISENSGHTKPWVVNVATASGLQAYVVKLYDTTQVDEHHRVYKEIVGNLLAKEFELKVPDCALINIPQELAVNLPAEIQQQYDNADPRPKFATQLLDGVSNAVIELEKKHFESRIEIDTLYAFDNLIRNPDRGYPKANLLLDNDSAFLIDHEYAFTQNEITDIDINTLQIEDRYSKTHLFYHFLKTARNKKTFFNEFSFYLENLSLIKLNGVFDQLDREGFNNYSAPILSWLNLVKEKKSIFVNHLKGSIS